MSLRPQPAEEDDTRNDGSLRNILEIQHFVGEVVLREVAAGVYCTNKGKLSPSVAKIKSLSIRLMRLITDEVFVMILQMLS